MSAAQAVRRAAAPAPARIAPFPGAAATPRLRDLDPAERRLLEELRLYVRQAQLAGPIDLNRVCALIDPGGAADYGRALIRALDATAGRRLVFHPRGATETGFDELWLVRLIRALEEGDAPSARFLIGGRVPKPGRRLVAWLAAGLAERRAGLDFGTIPD